MMTPTKTRYDDRIRY